MTEVNRLSGVHAVAIVLMFGVMLGAKPAVNASGSNGSAIAFEGDRFGDWGLAAMRPDGSGITDLGAPLGAADASWSPNGKHIAFEADPNGDGNLEIFVMDADGTNVRQLTDSPGRDYWADWFPNGQQIAFTSERTGVPNIYVMNADGSEQEALTDDTDFGNLEPDVSPNGRQVVFMRSAQFEPATIWTINVDGSGLTQLTELGPHDDVDPQWSPNGQRIVFSSNRGGTFEIFVMDADGTNSEQLTTSPGADFSPTFSPDGRQIAWWKLRFGQGDVWTMNVDGTGPVNITDTATAFESFPDWRPGYLTEK